jgi:hypothetical protein
MTSRIRIPTFDATVVFVRDVDRDCLQRYLKREYSYEIENIDDDFSGIAAEIGNMTWLIYVPDTNYGNDIVWLARTLSHEANHVALQMMKKIGVKDDETVCYTQDNILGELLKRCLKKKK